MSAAREIIRGDVMVAVVVLVTLLCGTAMAAPSPCYVDKNDPNAADDLSHGSSGSPWLTVAYGVAHMGGGNTLVVRNGNYTSEGRTSGIPSGSSGALSTVRTENPLGVTLYSLVVDSHTDCYVLVDGFVFDSGGSSDGGIQIGEGGVQTLYGNASYITIQNCEVKNSQSTGINTSYGTHHLHLKNNYVHDTGLTAYDGGHGIYLDSTDGVVEDCNVHDNGNEGIQINTEPAMDGSNNILKQNLVYNHNKKTGRNGTGIAIMRGDNNNAYNNMVWDNGQEGDQGISAADVSNCKIYNNVCHHNGGQGIGILSWNLTTNAIIRNNIITDNGWSATGCYGVHIQNTGYSSVSSVVVENNLFHNNRDGDIQDDYNPDVHTASNNISGQNPRYKGGTLGADYFKLMHNPPDGYTSPAIDAGYNLSGVVNEDYLGYGRPYNTNWDIGAYEYGSSPTTTTTK